MSSARSVADELKRRGVALTGICADSRQLRAGEVFVALSGVHGDGRAHIDEALARGAAAVLWEDDGHYDPHSACPALAVPALGVRGLRALSGGIADLVYGRAAARLRLIGVTGTNGKTSVSQWIAQAMSLLGRPCAVIGTLGSGFPGAMQAGMNTTPDLIGLRRTLSALADAGAEACALEASSIGLVEGRVAGLEFAVAVFTNLSRDHLDYHADMAEYGDAKARLFATPGLESAVLNLDDEFGRSLCVRLSGSGVRRLGYTLGPADRLAGLAEEILAAEDLRITGGGIHFTAHFTARGGESRARVEARLHGRFNAANLLAVLGALVASGYPLSAAAAVLAQLTPPPGRMQAVSEGRDEPLVVVDYAHSPDALEQALTTLREVAAARGGRLVCLFGCGGQRDAGKRPLMGAVAERLADRVLLANDNPRAEDPQAIIDDILQGMKSAPRVEPDRAAAIRLAVLTAAARDVVLLAGKGHESYQELGCTRLPFSDLEQAQRALSARRSER